MDFRATTSTANNLISGNYSVTVTDAHGCTQTLPFSITQPTPLASNAANVDVSCNGGNNGSVPLTSMVEQGPYSYAWNPTGIVQPWFSDGNPE